MIHFDEHVFSNGLVQPPTGPRETALQVPEAAMNQVVTWQVFGCILGKWGKIDPDFPRNEEGDR